MTMLKIVGGVSGLALAGVAAALVYVGFEAFLPWRENAEADRLANAVGLRNGWTIAEIGAGGGRFTAALAAKVGPAGRVYATELPGATLEALAARAGGLPNVTIIEAERTKTRLPDGCCDLVLLRNVYHHVGDPTAFLADLNRTVRPGGLVVVIDFEPGALWFHSGPPDDVAPGRSGHGVSQQVVAREFEAADLHLAQAEPRWSGPMWMSVFRAAITPAAP